MNALSEKISAGTQTNLVTSIPDTKIHIPTPRPVRREVLEAGGPPSVAVTDGEATLKHQKGTKSSENTRRKVTESSWDEWVEQDEPGVYITFIALPSGQKGLKRVRFRYIFFLPVTSIFI